MEQIIQNLEDDKSLEIPVLLAARLLQAFSKRAKTVFDPAAIRCYYRIIRELYGVAQPNWTVGAARAGVGGTTSAFITNECIRAILSLKNVFNRTYEFFEQTLIFYKNFTAIKTALEQWKIPKEHPLYIWADRTIEAMWLDCFLAVNPRNQEMSLFWSEDNDGRNLLLLPDKNEVVGLESATSYFDNLPGYLEKSLDKLFQNFASVYEEIYLFREAEFPGIAHPLKAIDEVNKKKTENTRKNYLEEEIVEIKNQNAGKHEFIEYKNGDEKEVRLEEERINKFNRTSTAHLFAFKAIRDGIDNANKFQNIIAENKETVKGADGKDIHKYKTEIILEDLAAEFYRITRRIQRVLEPSKQYLKWVLNRELAAPEATFDAGELVFAATSYGAIHNWRLDDRLTRACEKLISSLPDNGRLPSKRPFHADERGYRSVPIGFEMTRALANLLQKTGYHFDAEFVGKMLGVFYETMLELHESTAKRKLIAWNFENSPNPDKPAVWVTAISVFALDRIVRMLNTRINEIVLRHFDVTKPSRPHTQMTLRELIYSDYGLIQWQYDDGKEHFNAKSRLTALNMQKMRAHIMRATLPLKYRGDKKNYATIFYGPPGTGKTTLAESLALSSNVFLVKLSPSDLILQGQELIEGRARDVFEALAMLTQCVIIFDEFEPVLKNRKKDEVVTSIKYTDDKKNFKFDAAKISEALQKISQRDDPRFRFVLSGMLPKFGKLHDAAEVQSFVYCLGTNYWNDIDDAAKRPGRFDKKFPVYKPDTLSRAGTLLYRLGQLHGKEVHRSGQLHSEENSETNKIYELKASDEQFRRFAEIIVRTINSPAIDVGKCFSFKEKEDGTLIASDFLNYILFGVATSATEDIKIGNVKNKNLKNLEADLPAKGNLDEYEIKEQEFLKNAEKRFSEILDSEGDKIDLKKLEHYMTGVKQPLR